MKKNLLLSLTLATLCVGGVQAQIQASAIDGKKQTLFYSGNHSSTPYRIPAIATLNDGTILAIADQRPCGADVGNGEVDIYAKVGTINADGSYSWNPASTDPSADGTGLKIADGISSNGYGDAAVVVDRESGDVLIICVAGKTVFSNGSSSKHNKMARITATNTANGLSWNTPEDVTTAFFDNLLPDAYTMFMASGKMVQSRTVKEGSHYRIYGALLVRQKKNSISKENVNYVVYSDDFGTTWKLLGGGSCISSADEAKVEELPNGDIVISSRTKGGRIFNVYSNGSWGSSSTYTFSSGSEACNGELMLYKDLYNKADGKTYNVMLQSLPTASSRGNVSVYYKAFATDKSSWSVSDFTSGWTKGIEVDDGKSAYSTMTILPNGEIGFLYEDNYDTSKADGDYSDIVYVPLTVEEITGGAYTAQKPVVEPVAPTISLSAAATTLTAGESTQLTLTTNSDGAVSYKSSNTAVATVDNKGKVTAVAAGTATITVSVAATDNYNAATATCTITVKEAAVEPDPEEPEEPETPETPATEYKVNAISGKIGNITYYIATFSADKNTVIPSGVKAYYVKVAGGDLVTLTRIASGAIIPANEGVILMGQGVGEITITSTEDTNVTNLTGNCLKAAIDGVIPGGSYVLAVKGAASSLAGQFAFCLTSDALSLSGNRAYLSLSSAAPQMRMRVEEESTDIDNEELTIDNTPVIYDLMGRRVNEMQPGRVYIVNGRKIKG